MTQLFGALARAWFSPFTPIEIPAIYRDHGGQYLPPIPIRQIGKVFSTPPDPDNPLYDVGYYFVRGPDDPILPVVQYRPIVFLHYRWVTECVERQEVVNIEGHIVPLAPAQPIAVKVEPEAELTEAGGHQPGTTIDLAESIQPEGQTERLTSNRDLYHDEQANPTDPRPVIPPTEDPSMDLEDLASDPMFKEVQHQPLSSLSLGGVGHRPPDIASKLQQVHVDQSAFTSQKAFVEHALNQRSKTRISQSLEKLNSLSSSLSAIPDEVHVNPASGSSGIARAADPYTPPRRSGGFRVPDCTIRGKGPSKFAKQQDPTTPPRQNKRSIAVVLEETPIDTQRVGAGMGTPSSSTTATLAGTASSGGIDVDAKRRRFRYRLHKKKVFDFEDVYRKLWESETSDARIAGLERA